MKQNDIADLLCELQADLDYIGASCDALPGGKEEHHNTLSLDKVREELEDGLRTAYKTLHRIRLSLLVENKDDDELLKRWLKDCGINI